MKKRTAVITIALILAAVILLMVGEWRFIMHNQQLERGENATIYSTVFGVTDAYYVEENPTAQIKAGMTVDDVVSIASTDYFIVKDIDTWAILESDIYMEREVVEIAICDDIEDTLCLFIKLNENEEPHIRKVVE